ncbi:MAG: hypothetical protein ACTSW4_06515 [Candidatus Ranarchaeia archaeon]
MDDEDTDKKIRFKIKHGSFEFELEGPKEIVEEYMKKMLDTIPQDNAPTVQPYEGFSRRTQEDKVLLPRSVTMDTYPETARARLIYLQETGYFRIPRTLGEVTEQLAREGWHYNSKTIDNALRILITKDNRLRRIGKRGEYQYVQR